MKKELPGLFANKIDKPINNNENVAVTKSDERSIKKEKSKNINIDKTVNQKLKEIFSSTKYVYKIDVTITLKDKTVTKKIVGKNNQYLITIDNELIPISDIVDIKLN